MDKANPNANQLSSSELDQLQTDLPEWQVDTSGDTPRLTRTFSFQNFAEALAFTNKVGEAAEAADHHPLISLTWGEARVDWWSHSAGGITGNDVNMARATDGIFSAD
ncbi:MAG: 4a-hydroxytetrahydrobiopterin dehydratase [Gammaproteobacteria bacterium]|nr:4a-hydroxytetrahydrobiopterin dehydratase [Gammaproteobacteria bacterium]